MVLELSCTTSRVDTFLSSRVFGAWWPGAVSAQVNCLTFVLVKVLGNILLARGVWDSTFMSILVNLDWLSTIAATTSLAVYDGLSIEAYWSSGVSVTELDDESIS